MKKSERVTKILFVCHGNICRSPMAEFILKDMVRKAGISEQFEIASAATSTEEIGNPLYYAARQILIQHGIACSGHQARQLTRVDGDQYDLLIGMDNANIRNMRRICPQAINKIQLLLSYTSRPGEVDDPWYSGDFTTAWNDIQAGCEGLLASLRK